MATGAPSKKNTVQNTGPQRDARGRVFGGNPGNSGGKKGRSGRKPAAWKEACEVALQEAEAIPVLKKIIVGEYAEVVGTTKDGRPIYESIKPSDRIGAVKFLAGYAHGQPTEKSEVSGELTIKVQYDE